MDFSGYSAWGFISLIAVLLLFMLIANVIKKTVKFLKNSLVPTSVLGGLLLLVVSIIYEKITKTSFFNSNIFNNCGEECLELLTYHSLALGFIASALKPTKRKFNRERSREIFDSGVTTVSTYLLQGVLGLGITILAGFISKDIFKASGMLLPFGYGQGTGQALNYGNIYETATEYTPFIGGKSFGLTIAAFGFISASIGGVVHLNHLRRKGKYGRINTDVAEKLTLQDISSAEEISINGSIDKMTVQFGLIFLAYLITYLFMFVISKLLPSLSSLVYGFNFLFGVITASLVKAVINFLTKKKIIKKIYVNDFLMNRISGFFFDIMVIAGIAAIRIEIIKNYWLVLIVLGVVGAVSTYYYNRFVARKLFKNYPEEQCLVMYGMLTGTASTGIILLREIDNDFLTPAAENLVYQQIPAIVFGFPLMFLALLAPKEPYLTLGILVLCLIVMNIILFRSYIFKKKKKN